MAALARRGLAPIGSIVHPPADVIAATQPYMTVDAPALTVQFRHDPGRHEYQRLPLRTPGAPRLYQAALVARFLQFLHEPRIGPASQSFSSSADHVIPKLSSLTTEYTTVYQPHRDPPPHHASIELASLGGGVGKKGSGCGFAGLSLSLWDASHSAISTTLLTGTALGEELEQNANQFVTLLRRGQDLAPLRCDVADHMAGQGAKEVGVVRGVEEPFLVGDLKGVGTSSWSQHVAFALDGGADLECTGTRDPHTGAPLAPMTPWSFDVALLRAAVRVLAATAPGFLTSPEVLGHDPGSTWTQQLINTARVPPIALCSRNIMLLPFDMARPINFVMATPRVWSSFTVKPWEMKVGDPALAAESLAAVKYRAFQDGVVCSMGTAAFTPWRVP